MVYKRYNDGLPQIDLPRRLTATTAGAVDVLDAAFVVIAATEIATATDRGYREAQLGAGLAEGRLHLSAYALGAAASGMTFVDGLIPSLLGQPNMQGLLFTCIGVPEYTSKPGGHPGDPSAVQIVVPRF